MNYLYEAIDTNGQTVYGKVDAQDATEAQRQLLQMGYRPQSLAPNPAASAMHSPSVTTLPVVAERPMGGVTLPHPMQHQAAPVASPQRTGGITLAGNAAHTARQQRTTRTTQNA